MNTNELPAQATLSWEAPERLPVVRTRRWYMIAGLGIALCGLYAVATGAWLFLIVIVLGTGLYLSMHRSNPAHRMEIAPNGFSFDGVFTPWKECRGFWMIQGNGFVEVHIERLRGWNRECKILTGDRNPVEIFGVLARNIPHFPDRQERFLDAIIRICKL